MENDFTFKRAGEEDVDFIIETIIAAESMGTDIISYCMIFDINIIKFKKILREMVLEDIEGQEICISGYLIAKHGKENAGACCAWIEENEGMSSTMLKTNLLMYYIGKEKFLEATENIKILEEINFKRTTKALQLESFYVRPEYRGHGLTASLIKQHVSNYSNNNIIFDKAEIILIAGNDKAQKAYEKAKFVVTKRTNSENQKIRTLLPGQGKILMEAAYNKLVN